MVNADLALDLDLDLASARYLQLRAEFYQLLRRGESLDQIDRVRTLAHDALLACAASYVRNLPEGRHTKELSVALRDGRRAVGNWACAHALEQILASR
jgi:hypothetical protein